MPVTVDEVSPGINAPIGTVAVLEKLGPIDTLASTSPRRGMSPTIFYDGLNLSLKHGTGIATYTRNLTRAAREGGYNTAIAYALPDYVPADSVLREVVLFEDRKRKLRKIERWGNWANSHLGLYRRLPLHRTTPTGIVDTGPIVDRLPSVDTFYAGRQIFERGRLSFMAQHRFAELGLATPPDIAHFTFPTPLRIAKTLNLYTIHDLVPLRLPYTTMDSKRYFYRLHKEIARTADHIVTVSETSRRDIIRWLGVTPERVTNTFQAVSFPPHLAAKTDSVVANELVGMFGLEPGGYFLFFGAIEPKKNVGRLLEAFLSSGLDLPLVIVSSSGWQNEAELEIIHNKWFARRGLGDRRRRPKLKPISYVPYDLLISLVRGARAVTFPSLYEGFGLPVLEAMLLGTPVLTSNVSSLPEVAGDAAFLVDPTDVDAIRRGLVTLASDDDLCRDLSVRGRLQAEKFSPERYRESVVALYSKLGFPPRPRVDCQERTPTQPFT